MLNNNYIKWNDYFIPSTDQLDVVIAQLPPAEQSIQIRQLVCERIPPPNLPFDYENQLTHKWVLKTPQQLVDEYSDSDTTIQFWNHLLQRVPEWVKQVVAKGTDRQEGWMATVMELSGEDMFAGNEDIGDVYYIYKTETVEAIHFELDFDTNALYYSSNSTTGDPQQWANWQALIPDMAPINVSLTSGSPILIGWTDRTTSLAQFTLHYVKVPQNMTLLKN